MFDYTCVCLLLCTLVCWWCRWRWWWWVFVVEMLPIPPPPPPPVVSMLVVWLELPDNELDPVFLDEHADGKHRNSTCE